jgi:hypothetical protein
LKRQKKGSKKNIFFFHLLTVKPFRTEIYYFYFLMEKHEYQVRERERKFNLKKKKKKNLPPSLQCTSIGLFDFSVLPTTDLTRLRNSSIAFANGHECDDHSV